MGLFRKKPQPVVADVAVAPPEEVVLPEPEPEPIEWPDIVTFVDGDHVKPEPEPEPEPEPPHLVVEITEVRSRMDNGRPDGVVVAWRLFLSTLPGVTRQAGQLLIAEPMSHEETLAHIAREMRLLAEHHGNMRDMTLPLAESLEGARFTVGAD